MKNKNELFIVHKKVNGKNRYIVTLIKDLNVKAQFEVNNYKKVLYIAKASSPLNISSLKFGVNPYDISILQENYSGEKWYVVTVDLYKDEEFTTILCKICPTYKYAIKFISDIFPYLYF